MATQLTSLTPKGGGVIFPLTPFSNPNTTGFGKSLELTADGTRLAVGAVVNRNNASPAQGATFIYDFASSAWSEVSTLRVTNTNTLGVIVNHSASVSLSPSGKCLIQFDQFTSATAGTINKRFTTGTATWTGKTTLASTTFSSPTFEEKVGISLDGLSLLLGRAGLGSGVGKGCIQGYINNTTWETNTGTQSALTVKRTGDASYASVLKPPNANCIDFGWDIHYNSTYDIAFVGCPGRLNDSNTSLIQGSVLIYKITKNTTTQWEFTLLQEIFSNTPAHDERFGQAVTASPDGTLLFVGAPNTNNGTSATKGSIQTFRINIDPTTTAFTGAWAYVSTIVDSQVDANVNATFAQSLSLVNNTLAIGVLNAQNGSGNSSGKVLTYTALLEPYGTVTTRTFTLPINLSTRTVRNFSLPINLLTVTAVEFTLDVIIETSHVLSPTLDIQLSTRTVRQFSLDIHLTTSESTATARQYTLPIELSTYAVHQFNLDIELSTSKVSQFSLPIHLFTATRRAFELGINLTTIGRREFTLPIELTTHHYIVLTLPIHLTTRVASRAKEFTLPIKLRTVTRRVFSLDINLTTGKPTFQFELPIHIRTRRSVTLSLPIHLTTRTLPITGISAQGVGFQIDRKLSRHWTALVTIKGVDMTDRLTGVIKVQAKPTAARIATITVKPAEGVIDTVFFVAAKVTIDFVEHFSNSGTIEHTRIFTGVVDTPTIDVHTGLITLSCTDGLARAVTKLTEREVSDMLPDSYWSEMLYPRFNNRWEYLLQHLESYNYIVFLNTEGQVKAREFAVKTLKYEFTEATILDQSLEVTLGSTKGFVNHYDVSLTIQGKQFRETVRDFTWKAGYLQDSFAIANACSVQMIFDAVNGTGAKFTKPPLVGTLEASRLVTSPTKGTAALINTGTELLATYCIGSISKRYTQDVSTTFKSVVVGGLSQASVGVLPAEEAASVAVEYQDNIDIRFTAEKQETRRYKTASNNGEGSPLTSPTNPGVVIPETPITPRLGSISTFYGELPATFNTWETTDLSSPLPLQLVDRWMTSDYERFLASSGEAEPTDLHVGVSANLGAAGEHVFDLDAYVKRGNQVQLDTAYETLVRKAVTKITRSHRANFVRFTASISPYLELGDTLRVATRKVIATGVISEIDHTLDIATGRATTLVEISSSTTTPFPDEPPVVTGFVISLQIVVYTSQIGGVTHTPPNDPTNVSITVPYVNTGNRPIPIVSNLVTNPLTINYDGEVGNHFYTNEADVQEGWLGHIAPLLPNPGTNQFKFAFPEVPEAHTNAFTGSVSKGTITVTVPNDEFILRGY